MEDLPGLLHRDYGLRPQGKSAPMSGGRNVSNSNIGFGNPNPNPNPRSSSLNDSVFGSSQARFDDFNVFGGGAPLTRPMSQSQAASSGGGGDYDDIFRDFSAGPKTTTTATATTTTTTTTTSLPVYDAPVYDDDIFGGVRGVRTSVSYDDVFSSARSSSPVPTSFEDLLGMTPSKSPPPAAAAAADGADFDELIPGFGTPEPAVKHSRSSKDMKSQAANDSPKKAVDDPFVVLDAESFSSNASSATFHDPLEDFGIPISSGGANDTKTSSTTAAGISEIFDSFAHSIPTVSTTGNSSTSENLPRGTNETSSPNHRGANETFQGKSATDFVSDSEKNTSVAYSGRGITEFDLSSSNDDVSNKSFSNKDARLFRSDFPSYDDDISQGVPQSTRSDRATESVTDRWITIDEVILFTQPTRAPPPRRPPPPLFVKHDSTRKTSHFNDKRENSFSSIYKLEEFAMGGSHVQSNGDQRENYSAAGDSTAAMMEAMEKAEAKLKQAKEAREREKEEREREARMYRAKEKEREEKALQEAKEREEKERAARLAHEARLREEREREEQERERQRIERERELERERERDRIAVERATKEARERAAAEARERAQRAAVERATKEARERAAAEARERAATEARERAERERIERERVERAAAEARQRAAERAAVERAAGEARERAERAAVERAQAEARERAAAEAREKAERAVAEKAAVERAAAEVRMRAERVAVSRANAEARERAAAAAAAAKERQRTERRNDNDLESFFSNIGSRATSEPKQRPPTADSVFDDLFQNKTSSSTEGPRRAPPQAPASGMRKTASQTTMVDDFTSLFNAAPSSDVFQEVEGEAEERRRARWDRHQRTRERAAKALAEKNERDLQAQREQAERHRLAETVDAEIKRWAAGKEGNLRALLSTLQYILWPEAGWQPVSLTDVITAASVKKVYRKATLCVHPDKVQQKGATTQQKYIAEKVFDMLKEAWNKFNSEELF